MSAKVPAPPVPSPAASSRRRGTPDARFIIRLAAEVACKSNRTRRRFQQQAGAQSDRCTDLYGGSGKGS